MTTPYDGIGDGHLGWGEDGKYDDILAGSFNTSYIVKHSGDGRKVAIRFPVPGRIYEPWTAEKVANEVAVIGYISKHTTIPVPEVLFWGLAEQSPQQLGPFIVMEFVRGGPTSSIFYNNRPRTTR